MTSRYAETYRRSLVDREGFWAEAAQAIDWEKRWDAVLDSSRPPFFRWFRGARLNTCYNALDRHVAGGRAQQTALIYDSPVTGTVRRFSYRELHDEVALLACARLGAIHSVVFGGFAAPELATRIDDARPKLVLSASCGIEVNRVIPYKPLLDQAIALARHKPESCFILQRDQLACDRVKDRDYDWRDEVAKASPAACVPVEATDPLYILYTSGTTGMPKGIVRDNGGHAVALYWSMKNVYGLAPGETWFTASDVGWVVGHSYIVYAPLLYGLTTILFEGKPVGTPDAGTFWRIISQHGAVAMFTAPTAFRAIKREDPDGALIRKYDLAKFRTLFLAGERADPPTVEWAEKHLEVPVIDHWWQTETGWAITANCVGLGQLPVKHGSSTLPAPGYDLHVLDPSGKGVKPGEVGALCVKLPMPPGFAPTLWNADDRFVKS